MSTYGRGGYVFLEVPTDVGSLRVVATAKDVRAGKRAPAELVEWPAEALEYAEANGLKLPVVYAPPKGADAEFTTLQEQSKSVSAVDLDVDRLTKAASHVASLLPTTDPTGFDTHDMFMSCLCDLKLDSVPGYPYQIDSRDISGVLDNPVLLAELEKTVMSRMRALIAMPFNILKRRLEEDPTYALKHGLCDVLRVIIKREPNSKAKIDRSRWRFLLVLSLCDQMLERMAFSVQNKAEIKAWKSISSKPGMGMSDDDIHEINRFVAANQLSHSSDAEGWDQTVPYQMLLADAERRILCATAHPDGWDNLVRNLMALSAHKCALLSDGRVVVRKIPGAMASGRYVTSSSNSAIRAMCDVYVHDRYEPTPITMAMGDDAVSRLFMTPDAYVSAFKSLLGITLTDVELVSDSFEFCSHRYSSAGAEHLRPHKTVARVLMNGPGEWDVVVQRLASVMDEWRHTPTCAHWLHLLHLVSDMPARAL